MVRLVLMKRDSGSVAHLRGAPVSSDNQASAGRDRPSVLRVAERRRIAQGQGRDRHVPPGVGARCDRCIEQGLAVKRMAEAQRSGDVRREDPERKHMRLGRFRVPGFIVGDMARHVVAAGVAEQVV